MTKRRIISKPTPVELLWAIYTAEGWKRREGESMVNRAKTLYILTVDPRRNRYIATPRKN